MSDHPNKPYILLPISCRVSAKFGTGTVVGTNGTLAGAKIFTFNLERTNFIFNNYPIWAHDGANAKFSSS
jgi:hypothetical protein